MSSKFEFTEKLWRYPGEAAWYFISLPKELSNDIKLISTGNTVGLGYVRVRVTVGRTMWSTTLFPSKEGLFHLAIKADIRKNELLEDGDIVKGFFELV